MAKAQYFNRKGFSVSISSDETLMNSLEQMNDPEFIRRVARSAALAGARVISARAKEKAPVYDGPPKNRFSAPSKISGQIKPGELRDSIYHAFNERDSTPLRQSYSVSWNTAKVGFAHLIEFGHVVKNRKNGKVLGFAPPIPFIRGSVDRAPEALRAMKQRAIERYAELLKLVDKNGKLPDINAEDAP